MSGERPFRRHLARLRNKAPPATRLLLDLIESSIIPVISAAGFAPSPECEALHKNQFGLVWGVNDLAFQDRTVDSWPTIALQVERSLEPYVKVELFETPREPIMLDGTRLPREEANGGHCARLYLLRKGRANNYKDQHFGAEVCAFSKERKVRRDIELCHALIVDVVALPRASFLVSAEQKLAGKFLYKSWDERDSYRPNKSVA